MPNRNGTGPRGAGPITGKGMGPCGCGMRRGYGRGVGPGEQTSTVTLNKDEQKKVLQEQLKSIDDERQAIESKLKELQE